MKHVFPVLKKNSSKFTIWWQISRNLQSLSPVGFMNWKGKDSHFEYTWEILGLWEYTRTVYQDHFNIKGLVFLAMFI